MGINSETTSSREPSTKHRKSLLALMGIPLVGKTILGTELARQTNFVYLDVDVARRRIFAPKDDLPEIFKEFPNMMDPDELLDARNVLPQDLERFVMLTSYQANHEQARSLLQEGQPVILGASYSREIYHEMLKFLAAKTNSPLRTFLLDAPNEVLEQRLKRRLLEGGLSNVKTIEHVMTDRRRYVTIEGVSLTIIDTSKPLQICMEQILENLSDLRVEK